MTKYFKYVFISFLFSLMSVSYAQETIVEKKETPAIEASVAAEKTSVVQWVLDNAQIKLTLRQASNIVAQAYLQAFKRDLDPVLILSIIRTESGFRPTASSKDGSKGLMQVRAFVHKDKLKGRSPFNEEASIEVGSMIFKDCMIKHHDSVNKGL
jgi:soluble lytic murein transglycosylase-like protein